MITNKVATNKIMAPKEVFMTVNSNQISLMYQVGGVEDVHSMPQLIIAITCQTSMPIFN